MIRDDRRHPTVNGSRLRADPAPRACEIPEIVDDLPDLMPVTPSELDVIETYLGSLLDDLLKRGP
jgi:hypothetical protein